jgi:hypothetical protein
MVQTSQRLGTVILHGVALPSQPERSASFKIYPVKDSNFSCRLSVRNERPSERRKSAEILLTAEQLRALASDLISRAEVIEQNTRLSAVHETVGGPR